MLLSLATAKLQLHETDARRDDEVQLKLDEAEAIILGYMKPAQTGVPRPDWPWTPATLPKEVETAILLMLTYLWNEGRGDEPQSAEKATGIWKAIEGLTARLRDPAIA